MKHRYNLIICTLAPLFISSCGGLAVGSYGTHERFRADFKLGENRNSVQSFKSVKYDKNSIVALWGESDEEGVDGAYETITYYNGKNWSGIGAFVVVVPIPLMLPSGHSRQTFYLSSEECVGLVEEYGEIKSGFGYMCGSNECKFISGRVNRGKIKGEVNWSKKLSTKSQQLSTKTMKPIKMANKSQ